MLVALNAVLVINGAHAGPDLVGDSGGCNCTLLVQPTPTYTDVGLDLQLAGGVLLSINWRKYSTCTPATSILYCVVMVVCGCI